MRKILGKTHKPTLVSVSHQNESNFAFASWLPKTNKRQDSPERIKPTISNPAPQGTMERNHISMNRDRPQGQAY